MDMSTEIIAIDHGWSQIKTLSYIFTTGVKKIRNKPAFMNDVLEYNGSYYKIGTVNGGIIIYDGSVGRDVRFISGLHSIGEENFCVGWGYAR